MAEKRKFSFRENCRQRIAPVGVIPYAANQPATPLELPRVGMLNALILHLEGNMTYSASPTTFTNLGPWSIVNRIKFGINLGSALICDLSGYGAFLITSSIERDFRPDKSIGPQILNLPDEDIYVTDLSTVASPKPVSLTWIIPIAANDAMGFSTGLINLQAPEVRAQLDVSFNDHTQFAATATGFTGAMSVFYKYYEVPNPQTTQIPPLTLHRILEEQQAVNTTGEQVYTLPRMGVLMQLFHVLNINGARQGMLGNVNSPTEFQIKFNKTDSPYRMQRQQMRLLQRLHLGVDLPFGVYVHDFWHATQEVSEGDLRDCIDTEAISTVESTIVVPSTAVLGVGNNNLISVRRILQAISQRVA